jgi:hypothetical protein
VSSFMLKSGDGSPFAAMVRAACGFSPTEDVEVATPTFNRPSNWIPAMLPPDTPENWRQLQRLTADQLHAWGCRRFSPYRDTPPPNERASHKDAWFWEVESREEATHELWLFPAEWYDSIPNGFPLTCIDGCIESFIRGKTDDDRRFGLLAYGLMVRLGVDGGSATASGNDTPATPKERTGVVND